MAIVRESARGADDGVIELLGSDASRVCWRDVRVCLWESLRRDNSLETWGVDVFSREVVDWLVNHDINE